eukprot:m.100053 g.100053  ORF g.100053 m.100053 type:complete len:236 (+) comp16774_c0_seq2:275-982(+)
MGRVARYKRPKANVGKSAPPEADRLTALPPTAQTEKLPRGLRTILKVHEKMKKKVSRSNKNESGTEQDDPNGTQAVPRTKQETKAGKQSKLKKDLVKGKKESLFAFGKRVDKEMAHAVYAASHKTTKKAAKKKAWNDARREKDREDKRRRTHIGAEGETGDLDPLYQKDPVQFGEVAFAPPQLKSKPKFYGSLKRDPLLLQQQAGSSQAPIRRQQLATERERVIQAYRDLKKGAS